MKAFAGNLQEKTGQTAGAIILAMAVAAFLALIKFAVGVLTHSLAISASALDSLMDVATSAVNLLASQKAAKPPDAGHPYGHEKIESLAGLFQSTIIAVSGVFLVAESVKRLVAGSYVRDIPLGLAVMAVSAVITLFLTWRLRVVARKNHSLILETESLHYTTDLLANVGAMLALVMVRVTGLAFWDLILALITCAYIFRTAFSIMKRTVDELLDRSLPPVSKEEIEGIIMSAHPSIVNFHNFRSRRVGDQVFLDFHIDIRGENDFRKAHDMTEDLIDEILKQYPGADITVHYDPEGAK